VPELKGTKTHENLKEAFAGESQANRRYLYFARRADIEGYPEVGGLFRDISEAETRDADRDGIPDAWDTVDDRAEPDPGRTGSAPPGRPAGPFADS
jgi:hypothetical protein